MKRGIELPVGFNRETIDEAELRSLQKHVLWGDGTVSHRQIELLDACISYVACNAPRASKDGSP